eukprot:gene10262-7286_t
MGHRARYDEALVEYYAGAFDLLRRALIYHQQRSPVKENEPCRAPWMGQDDVPIASSPTKGPVMRGIMASVHP